MSRLLELYKTKIIPELIRKYEYGSVMQVPETTKKLSGNIKTESNYSGDLKSEHLKSGNI